MGSTEYIIKALDAAAPGSSWAIGTELNLVRRLAAAHPDKNIHYLDSTVCFCSTMNRIDLPHLVWAMESLVAGRPVNRIVVDADDAHWARVALDQMLALPGILTMSTGHHLRVGIFVFDDAEELDVVGPYEVLASWARHSELRPEVVTFSLDGNGVRCAKGLRLVPDLRADDVGPLHVLVYPGGRGTRALAARPGAPGVGARRCAPRPR